MNPSSSWNATRTIRPGRGESQERRTEEGQAGGVFAGAENSEDAAFFVRFVVQDLLLTADACCRDCTSTFRRSARYDKFTRAVS